MTALFCIIYAAHANGTHHKLALDSLRSLRAAKAELWTRLFLKHADQFMHGAKAPDTKFKDFKNHVLHVGDNYWGGAPEQAAAWYEKTVAALKEKRWADAVYAAGVLSHYYTDPIQPFHTGQTEAENSIHRAAEWSISRSYDDLRRLGEQLHPALDVEVAGGRDWLKTMVCQGAEFSHRYYEKLLAHYDIHRGVIDPPSGLDGVARGIVAELLIYAATGFARILDRATEEAAVEPPKVALTTDTLKALIKIPSKMLLKRLSNREDRALVHAMYDELKATGRVEKTLPEDDRMVRDLHAREVLAPLLMDRRRRRVARVAVAPASADDRTRDIVEATPSVPIVIKSLSELGRLNLARSAAVEAAQKTSTGSVPSIPLKPANETPSHQYYLSMTDDLEAAPSIGPRLAERFASLGLSTVQHFLDHDADKLAERLADRRLDSSMLAEWQNQARLVIEVSTLRGTHAQLLTGAGYSTAQDVADAEPGQLCADVLKFAATTDGKRILRDGNPPDIEKIKGWVEAAAQGRAA